MIRARVRACVYFVSNNNKQTIKQSFINTGDTVMDNNNNNHRAYGRAHETEISNNWRLGCWVEPESCKDRAVRWGRCILEGVCLAFLMFVFCALCAMA